MKKIFLLLTVGLVNVGFAQIDSVSVEAEDIFSMSLEDLMETTITSVSKKEERLQDVSSSIYVLTADDIAKSSANNLHELLMLVPGYWGTQEEFNRVVQPNIRVSLTENSFTGSVLYLLDGTPLQDVINSTFLFEGFDLPLDDIERIEVIRGSGGTIYGANSATGVVSIYTKSPDKYGKKINASVTMGSPTFVSAQLNGGVQVTDKFSIGYYGKVRQFNGYGVLDELSGDSVTVPKSDGSGDVRIKNRFTEDFEKTLMTAFGLKMKYKFSENTSLSVNTHYNDLKRNQYTNAYTPKSFFQKDTLFHNENKTMDRFVGNVKFEKKINDNNSFFTRYSTNMERSFSRFGGGVAYENAIHDLEFQYNLTKGINGISAGANFRLAHLKITDRNAPEIVTFRRYSMNENLKGIFVQNQLELIEDKLTAIVGVKAENYTLVNDVFYFSPNVRLAYKPTSKVTIWGAVSQSYTTPAYTQTDLTYDLFQANSLELFNAQAYKEAFVAAKKQGATDAQADAGAKQAVASDPTINAQREGFLKLHPKNKNISITNGDNTVPTKFTNFEVGFRANVTDEIYVESNGSYTQFVDGVTNTPSQDELLDKGQDHPTEEGEKSDLIYYGNYLKGNIVSMENMIRVKPIEKLSIEFSHALVLSKFEYQETDDFDASLLTEENKAAQPKVPLTPENVFRLKVFVSLPYHFTLSVNGLYATKYQSQNLYQYDAQNFRPFHIRTGGSSVGANATRSIVNFKLGKSFNENKYNVFVFGNDIFNTGRVETTRPQFQTTVSQTRAMYGIGVKASF